MLPPRIRRLKLDHDSLVKRFAGWPLIRIAGTAGMPPSGWGSGRCRGLWHVDGDVLERQEPFDPREDDEEQQSERGNQRNQTAQQGRKGPGNPAHFYSIVTRDTVDQDFGVHRQLFLTEQGYRYEILDANDLVSEGEVEAVGARLIG